MKTSCIAVLILCLFSTSAQAIPLYRVIDLNVENFGLNRPNLGREWGWGQGFDINNDRVIAGEWQDNAFLFDLKSNSFLGNGGRFTTSGNSYATGVNNLGQVVGFAEDMPDGTGDRHFFVYDYNSDSYSVLGPLPFGPCNVFCLDIADDGTLIRRAAFVGPSGTELLALIDPTLGYISFTPMAMNSRGIIVGGSGDRVLVLTPTNVPEPSTLALIGLGLAGLGIARRNRPR